MYTLYYSLWLYCAQLDSLRLPLFHLKNWNKLLFSNFGNGQFIQVPVAFVFLHKEISTRTDVTSRNSLHRNSLSSDVQGIHSGFYFTVPSRWLNTLQQVMALEPHCSVCVCVERGRRWDQNRHILGLIPPVFRLLNLNWSLQCPVCLWSHRAIRIVEVSSSTAKNKWNQ